LDHHSSKRKVDIKMALEIKKISADAFSKIEEENQTDNEQLYQTLKTTGVGDGMTITMPDAKTRAKFIHSARVYLTAEKRADVKAEINPRKTDEVTVLIKRIA